MAISLNSGISNGNNLSGNNEGFNITGEDVVDTALDFVPIAGGVKDIYKGISDGDGWGVALGVGSIILDVATLGSASFVKGAVKTGIKAGTKVAAKQATKTGSRVFEVGSYNTLKGVEAGLEAHHVGQRALMKKFVPGYNANTAPSILVPKQGHTLGSGVLSRGTSGFSNARQVLTRDIFELRRVYPNVPNSSLQQLIQMNKTMYPGAFIK